MKVLGWKNYESISSSSFKKLYDDTLFTDVTLACEGNKTIEAHRVILSACSSSFHEILQGNEHPPPLIYLQGMDIKYLILLKKFMYLGKAMVEQDDILPFVEMSKTFLNTETEENPQTMEEKPKEKQGHNNSISEKTMHEQIKFPENSLNLAQRKHKFITGLAIQVEKSSGESRAQEMSILEPINISKNSVKLALGENKFPAEVVSKVEQSFRENDPEISLNPNVVPMTTTDCVTSLVTNNSY